MRSWQHLKQLRSALVHFASLRPAAQGFSLSAGFRKQLAADQHAADFTGAGTNFIKLGIAPEAAQRVLVDVAVAAKNLHALARHPGGFFGAPQNDRSAVLA